MKTSHNTVLITGGASGIGLALARQFLQQNNSVIVCGRDAHKLSAAQQRLPQLNTMQCDITSYQDLAELQAQLQSRFARLNILVNNAGIQTPMDFAGTGVEEALIEREIQTNLTAHIQLTHRLLSMLSSQPQSAVVFVGSALARVPKHTVPLYSAAKAGIHGFAQSLRFQLSGTKTRVIEVVPDLVDTAMTADRPQAKKITPEDLAKSVIRGLKKDDTEILIGRTGLLFALHRLSPSLAAAVING